MLKEDPREDVRKYHQALENGFQGKKLLGTMPSHYMCEGGTIEIFDLGSKENVGAKWINSSGKWVDSQLWPISWIDRPYFTPTPASKKRIKVRRRK